MKRLAVLLWFCAVICGNAVALTTFNATVDGDFNNAANWDNGLPTNDNGPGEIASGTTATMSASYLMANNAAPSVTDIIVNGTLNTGAFELQLRSGLVSDRTSDVFVGDGAGTAGVLNVDAGGRIDIAGAAADMLIGSNGGYGTVNFLDGSTWQMSKTVEVLNGKLSLASTVTFASSLGDELVVDNGGTLTFETAGTAVSTITGSSLILELGSASTLELITSGAAVGDNWVLMNGISSFTGVAEGDGTGIFGNVLNNEGLTIGLDYDVTAGTLTATVVPEPATMILLGLGSLVTLRRKYR